MSRSLVLNNLSSFNGYYSKNSDVLSASAKPLSYINKRYVLRDASFYPPKNIRHI
jgi:hypothetical protein